MYLRSVRHTGFKLPTITYTYFDTLRSPTAVRKCCLTIKRESEINILLDTYSCRINVAHTDHSSGATLNRSTETRWHACSRGTQPMVKLFSGDTREEARTGGAIETPHDKRTQLQPILILCLSGLKFKESRLIPSSHAFRVDHTLIRCTARWV